MERLFFDLHECGTITTDDEGRECETRDAARAFAIEAARDVMVDEVRKGALCLACAIVVRDANGAVAFALPFSDALSVTFAGSC